MEKSKDLSLMDLLQIVFKNIILILCSCIIFGILAFGYVKYKNSSEPYVAKTSVVIYNPSKTKYDQYGVYNKELGRMDTYEKIAENNVVLKHAQSEIKGDKKYNVSDIKKAVSIKKVDQTTILSISAKTSTKNNSIEIANATAKAVKNYLNNYINAGNVNVLASANKKSVGQDLLSTKKYVVVGMAFGFIVSVLVVLIKDVLYKQYKERK